MEEEQVAQTKNASRYLQVPSLAGLSPKRNPSDSPASNQKLKMKTDPISAAHARQSLRNSKNGRRPSASWHPNAGALSPNVAPVVMEDPGEWQAVPIMIQNFAQPGERVSAVRCGSGHTLAITQRGSIYSWGEGFEGKLGLGYSSSLRMCENQTYPKKITKGLRLGPPDTEEAQSGGKDLVCSAGCGKSISVAIMLRGRAVMWGKGEYNRLKFDDLKQYSRPFRICQDVKIRAVSVGMAHCMLIDKDDQLWVLGDNSHGCLGTVDVKKRVVAYPNLFFRDKRVIDVACGDRFTVVIAEVYNFAKGEAALYGKERDPLATVWQASKQRDRSNGPQSPKKLNSVKMDIRSARRNICADGSNRVPRELRVRVQDLLQRSQRK